MSRRRELQFKKLCETARMIEDAREAGHIQQVEALLALLRAQCALQDVTGEIDTHELEALADYTPDAMEAINLYRKAIAWSEHRHEPTYTKRIWMAARLIELGDNSEARSQLIRGRVEAERLRGAGAMAYADELLARLTV
jgi:hypothetical protein